MKVYLIILAFIIFLLSYHTDNELNLDGHWKVVPHETVRVHFRGINISGNRVWIIDNYLFQKSGELSRSNNELILNLATGQNALKLTQLHKDSLELSSGLVLTRNNDVQNFEFEEYHLLGLETTDYLSDKFGTFDIVHSYLNASGDLTIRVGAKSIDLTDISNNVMPGHTNRHVLLFVGQGVKLIDLRKIYQELYFAGCSSVLVATKHFGLSNYCILRDRIDFWWEEMASYEESSGSLRRAPPPPPPSRSKKSYLANNGLELKIENKADINKIDLIDDDNATVISISSKLATDDYFDLKQKLNKKYKFGMDRVITEIK